MCGARSAPHFFIVDQNRSPLRVGWAAPFLLVTLRLAQRLALGGKYGGAAT